MTGVASPVRSRNVVRGAGVVAILCVAIVAGVYAYLRFSGPHPQVWFSGFTSPTTSLRVGDEIRLENTTIAVVDSLKQAGTTVGLSVAQSGRNETPALVTLSAGSGPIQIAGDFIAELDSGRRVTLLIGGHAISLEPGTGRHYTVVADAPGVRIQGHEARGGESVEAGSVLTAGGFDVQVAAARRAVRAVLGLDTTRIARLMRKAGRDSLITGGVLALLGPGSQVNAGSGLGLTEGGLRLRLAPYGTSLWMQRQQREVALVETGDIQEMLQAVATYLTSPSAMYAEPTNRVERAVDDMNGVLGEARVVARRVNEVMRGSGWLLRAAFDSTRQHHVDEAVDSVTGEFRRAKVAHVFEFDTTLKTIGGAFTTVRDTLTGRMRGTSDLLDRQLKSPDSVSLVARVGATLDTIRPSVTATLGHADRTLASATRTMKTAKVVAITALPLVLLSIIHLIAHFP